MNNRETQKLERTIRADGHDYITWMGIEPVKGQQPAGHYALSVGDVNRIFYSSQDYQQWKNSHTSQGYNDDAS